MELVQYSTFSVILYFSKTTENSAHFYDEMVISSSSESSPKLWVLVTAVGG